MKNKDFREIQVSSSLLVVIFLGVLALGVFIFLLGVSVGKKQVRIASPTQVVTQQIPEPVKEPPVEPTPTEAEAAKTQSLDGGTPSQRMTAEAASKSRTKDVPPKSQKAPARGSGLYFVQIGAFTEKAQAQALAETYKKQGYTAVVADPRPTDTRTQYRVRLGGYTSRDRAVDLLGKLNAAAGKKTDYFVVRD
jgi:cell division septation protein DedD